jgi:hypothetical protein
MKRLSAVLLLCAAVATVGPVDGTQALPVLALQTNVEDHQEMLVARATVDGKPVEGATVAFFVQRRFGDLPLGQDQTLDDGTAAVPFPAGLPGGATGKLLVIARIRAPPQYTSVVAQVTFDGGAALSPVADPFPRALWSPRAPLPLILAIFVLLGGVWFTFIYVTVQLVRIQQGGRPV